MKYEYKFSERLTITGEVDRLKHIIRLASFLEELPDKCPICQSEVRPFFREPKGYQYYGLRCISTPAHETNFGQKKDTGELFYKNEWQEEYQGNGESGQSTQKQEAQPPPPEEPPQGGETGKSVPF